MNKHHEIVIDKKGIIIQSTAPMIQSIGESIGDFLPIFYDLSIITDMPLHEIDPYECTIDGIYYFFHLSWVTSKGTPYYIISIKDNSFLYKKLQQERSLKNSYKIEKDQISKSYQKVQEERVKTEIKNDQLNILLNHSREGIIYIDASDNHIITINKRGLEIFGVEDISTFINKISNELYIHTEDGRHQSVKEYYDQYSCADYISSQKRVIGVMSLTRPTQYLSYKIVADKTDKAHPKHIILYSDITQEHSYQIQLHNKNEQLQRYIESNIQLEQFAHVASHDLQAPIISVKSFSKLMIDRMNDKLSPAEQQYLRIIYDNANQMDELVTDLLEYSKINSQAINKTNVKLCGLIEEVISNLQVQAQENNVTLSCKTDEIEALIDKVKIKRVLQNLIANAIKFHDPAKESTVEVTVEQQNDQVIIHVRDNGIGIPVSNIDIFEPYKQLNNKAKYKGSGMGLAICKKIIMQHNGIIDYSSESGRGTDFWFSLPIK